MEEVWELCIEWNRSAVEPGEDIEEVEAAAGAPDRAGPAVLLLELAKGLLTFPLAGESELEWGSRPGYGLAP